MYIQTLTDIKSVPTPALGLLPAIHDAEVESVAALNREFVLEDLAAAVNQGDLVRAVVDGEGVVLTAQQPGVLEIAVTASRENGVTVVSEQGGTAEVPQITRVTLNADPAEGDTYSVVVGGLGETGGGGAYSLTVGSLRLPVAADARGRVFVNDAAGSLVLPATGRWPARTLAVGEFAGGDGRLHYRVVHKPGTTSYYPHHFERTVYTFSFSDRTFPIGEVFEFSRYFYFRLVANNTTAVWSVIFEVGERIDQSSPQEVYELEATLTAGSKVVRVSDARLAELIEMMEVTGEGVPEDLEGKTYLWSVDAVAGEVTLTQAATLSGVRMLTFRAGTGPNIERIKWLPPMLEEQVLMTDLKSMNELGIWIKNHGEQGRLNPDGTYANDPSRNEAGFEAYKLIYANRYPVPLESMPTSSNFLLRLRIGQFDTENTTADPRGYAAYVIRADEEDSDSADSA
jgi:hypothetical protein